MDRQILVSQADCKSVPSGFGGSSPSLSTIKGIIMFYAIFALISFLFLLAFLANKEVLTLMFSDIIKDIKTKVNDKKESSKVKKEKKVKSNRPKPLTYLESNGYPRRDRSGRVVVNQGLQSINDAVRNLKNLERESYIQNRKSKHYWDVEDVILDNIGKTFDNIIDETNILFDDVYE